MLKFFGVAFVWLLSVPLVVTGFLLGILWVFTLEGLVEGFMRGRDMAGNWGLSLLQRIGW